MMEFNLKQWRHQEHESEEEQEEQRCAKIPRQLFLETPQHQHQEPPSAAALPLFVSSHSESQTLPNSNKITPHLPPNLYSSGIPTFPRSCWFSITQWQELELQALIFKHMMAGAAVPEELLELIKKSLHQYPRHFEAGAWYWGKGGMDPEPGRCRRTDGKKWRCSRDVVAGHKYCDRHVHRGRNRSRKHVEFPASASASASASSLHSFHLYPRSSEVESEKKSSDKVLMHLFDDWPSSSNGEGINDNSNCMSNKGNSTSDFLRLSTGNGNGDEVGGPLGEALRLSTPTSVLHQLPPISVSDTTNLTA